MSGTQPMAFMRSSACRSIKYPFVFSSRRTCRARRCPRESREEASLVQHRLAARDGEGVDAAVAGLVNRSASSMLHSLMSGALSAALKQWMQL